MKYNYILPQFVHSRWTSIFVGHWIWIWILMLRWNLAARGRNRWIGSDIYVWFAAPLFIRFIWWWFDLFEQLKRNLFTANLCRRTECGKWEEHHFHGDSHFSHVFLEQFALLLVVFRLNEFVGGFRPMDLHIKTLRFLSNFFFQFHWMFWLLQKNSRAHFRTMAAVESLRYKIQLKLICQPKEII